MSKPLYLVALITLSACSKIPYIGSHTTKQPIEFKGISLGKAGGLQKLVTVCYKEEEEDYMARRLCDDFPNDEMGKILHINFGAGKAFFVIGIEQDGSIFDIFSPNSDRSAILEDIKLFTIKYGEPFSKEIKDWENKLGEKRDREVYTWIDSDGNKLILDTRGDKSDEGTIEIMSAAYSKAKDDYAKKEMEAESKAL